MGMRPDRLPGYAPVGDVAARAALESAWRCKLPQKPGVGARAMGLGSAYVALADDPTASYWNPAGLAAIKNTQVTAMHNEWILDFRQEYAAVATKQASTAPATRSSVVSSITVSGPAFLQLSSARIPIE